MSMLKRYQLDPTIRKDRCDMMGYRSTLPQLGIDIYFDSETDPIPLHIISNTLLERWVKRKGYSISWCKSRIGNYYLILTTDKFHKLGTIAEYNLEIIKELV